MVTLVLVAFVASVGAQLDNFKSTCRLDPHPSVEYRCLLSGGLEGSRRCGAMEPAGTVVSPRCRRPNYYSATPLNFMRCFVDGSWDSIARCSPECGRVTPDGAGLVIGGVPVKRGELPWHAGIYSYKTTFDSYMQVCGGSLISTNVVLSAAHCFWTDLEKQQPAFKFSVAVGKLYRAWNDQNDLAQKSTVKAIHIPPAYQGIGANFQDDIAVVIVARHFTFETHVRPVCLSFEYQFEQQQLYTGNMGKVAGWGLTAANGKASPALQVVDLPYVEVGICINKSPLAFREYVTSDKICAGTLESDSALCKGDSGGGLAFPDSSRGAERYYLRGVASTSASSAGDDACNPNSYTAFTSVRKHEHFIKEFWSESGQFKCQDGSFIPAANYCDGSVECGDRSDESAWACGGKTCGEYLFRCEYGACVDRGALCNGVTECADGSDEAEAVCAGFGNNITLTTAMPLATPLLSTQQSSTHEISDSSVTSAPRKRLCRLDPHHSVEYRCLVSGHITGSRACEEFEPAGTVVSPECRRPNYYSPTPLSLMRCIDGYWDFIARCIPECGTVTPSGVEMVYGGHPAKKGELPWHAGIYVKTVTPYSQICAGSLISTNLIISAAHCFWSDVDRQLPATQYAVAVGKIYRPWDDPIDEAQKSDVKEIHLPQRFQGAEANFQDDIAVIIVSKLIQFKTFIRPVCLDFDLNFGRQQLQAGNKGKVGGWGLTSVNGMPSRELRLLEMPYVPVDTCLANIPRYFSEYITSDKICAGTRDNTTALCKYDSGGGLAFPAQERGTVRHYLRGVASTAPTTDHLCNTATYMAFTYILKHEHFIKQFWTDTIR